MESQFISIIADVVGMIGTFLIVLAYFLLQLGKLDATSAKFNLINLIGALALLFSLCIHFNLASFVIELFWIVASMIGLYRYYKRA